MVFICYTCLQKSFGNIWLPQTADSGHRIDVIDIRWDPTGQFLVSAGKDKSVRVHCPRKGYSDPNKGGMVRHNVTSVLVLIIKN